MSKTGEEWINKLNREEDERNAKKRIVSDCCMAEVVVLKIPATLVDPAEPRYYCLKCDRECDTLVIDENEEEI